MNDAQWFSSPDANFVATYLEIGRAIPGAKRVEDDGFVGVVSPSVQAIGNFASRLRLDPWSAARLAKVAHARDHFTVYALPGDQPEHRQELLERQGFRSVSRLYQMIDEQADPGAYVDLRAVSHPLMRLQVGHFMASQFFPAQSADYRREIAQAIADAEKLELMEYALSGQRVGAMMISRTPGWIGLYNLCVDSRHRGRGLGSAMVRWAIASARKYGQGLTLQCDYSLKTWYELLGFRFRAEISVFDLCNSARADIIS